MRYSNDHEREDNKNKGAMGKQFADDATRHCFSEWI